MSKICDHTSVGMFAWKDERLLLIERATFPFGFSVPAGHVDGDATYEESAKRELFEEVGLTAEHVELIAEGRKENTCRREGGAWHYWKLYTIDYTGEVNPDKEEVRHVDWYTKQQLQELADKTEKYIRNEIKEDEWQQNPGLTPTMYEWFKELELI